ncbi:folylpolyglutamate synthase, mitochondrial [Sabethes cyaneus]|uniref:folylpolyglutamate synthase, mitochondrial n=1 Tax=Sabethes cyaneus TaxID=53552 RepID=UPI00237EE1C0|nr:folylpolyglutamate synthase, mitochondrial [Sabethes cyaneus]
MPSKLLFCVLRTGRLRQTYRLYQPYICLTSNTRNMLLPVRQVASIAAVLNHNRKMVLETSTRAAASSAEVAVNSPKVNIPPAKLHQNYGLEQPIEENYENAVNVLNTLQSNYSVIQNSTNRHTSDSIHIQETLKYLGRIGISTDQLDKLPAIHISGSKGKGSTCSLVESILRAHGYRTGFFSSPHLVSVTERIRLNGVPIEKDKFGRYFWKVYSQLYTNRTHPRDLPAYFNCLTILAFDIFLREKVDVAIIEVGIGGRYDCTNVLRQTKTIGITSLGLEHTKLLGDSLDEIAWQKAGIIKNASDTFTVCQPNCCLDVIREECQKMNSKFHLVPDIECYQWERKPNFNSNNLAFRLNMSLAVQIALNWIGKTRPEMISTQGGTLSEMVSRGIENCFWPGRCHQILKDNKRLFLDGAHTVESMEICARWFQLCQRQGNPKLLIFNATGDRDSGKLLNILNKYIQFDAVFFSPNVASHQLKNIDSLNLCFPNEQQIKRCEENERFWNDLTNQHKHTRCKAHVHLAIDSILKQVDNNYSSLQECDILVTGSLHLIGAVLTALKMESHVISAT